MAEQHTRTHLYEIDVIRAVTAICVVGVHAVSFTVILTHTPLGAQLQNAVVSGLHFTREIFMAITAFVLVYGYANRPFPAKKFWRKRGLAVLLPYVIWSIFYTWTTQPHPTFLAGLLRTGNDILTGSASYQLYYILLTLEFYIVLPAFLWFIVRAGKHPWKLLGTSFVLQTALLFVDYRYLQTGPFAATRLAQLLTETQNRFILFYQFYVIFGALAALYMSQVRAWVLQHGALIVGGLALSLALLWGNFFYQVDVAHQSLAYGTSVFQPVMAFYALALAAFLYWISYRWAIHRAPQPPRGYRFWLLLSDVSFGIYLVHAYLLDQSMRYVVPFLPASWPEPLRVALVWLLVAGGSVALCVFMFYVPLLSRVIGRPSKLRRDVGVGHWLDVVQQRIAMSLRQRGRPGDSTIISLAGAAGETPTETMLAHPAANTGKGRSDGDTGMAAPQDGQVTRQWRDDIGCKEAGGKSWKPAATDLSEATRR